MSLSKFFRGLIAITLAFSVAFITLSQPVLAAPNISRDLESTIQMSVDQFDQQTSVFSENSVGLSDNQFLDDFAQELVKAAEGMIAGAIVCYSLDGIATLFFPPAAAAAAFCPALPTFTGGTLATKTANAVIQAL